MQVSEEITKLENAVGQAIDLAKSLGATASEVAITKTEGLSVSTRLKEVETVEFNLDGALGITVYHGNRKGSASTADLSEEALKQAVSKAIEIAKHTSEDPCAGIADKDCLEFSAPDLELYHPADIDSDRAIELAKSCEEVALDYDPRITNSDGCSFSSHVGVRVYGNSHGLIAGYPSSRHSLSCVVIASDGDDMQRDYAYTVSREMETLKEPQSIGEEAAKETIARLNGQKIATAKMPVMLHRDIASGFLGHFVSAISGGNIFRKSSFLLDKLNQPVFPEWVHIEEKPHIKRALASSPFDSEGVKTRDMTIVDKGAFSQYLLNSYSARKLGFTTNGHAGGIHNWQVADNGFDFDGMLKEMGTGFLVTELMGQGVNIVNGDYSRGAAGFWVENGEIQFPVSEVTIAGNLEHMFKNLRAIGSDVDYRGSIHCGSILLDDLQLAGS